MDTVSMRITMGRRRCQSRDRHRSATPLKRAPSRAHHSPAVHCPQIALYRQIVLKSANVFDGFDQSARPFELWLQPHHARRLYAKERD